MGRISISGVQSKHIVGVIYPNVIQFVFSRLLQLISHEKRCNKVKDCEDGTDEVNCRCGDYLKIFHPTAVCDGVIDCLDSSDEIACRKLIKLHSIQFFFV